jgi:hypothetical protein
MKIKRKSDPPKEPPVLSVPNHSERTGGYQERTGDNIVGYLSIYFQFLRTMVMNPKNRAHNYQGSGPVYDNHPT